MFVENKVVAFWGDQQIGELPQKLAEPMAKLARGEYVQLKDRDRLVQSNLFQMARGEKDLSLKKSAFIK